jgi:small GTP-binding protein
MIPTIGIGLYHLGVEFKNKFIQVEGKNNKLQIWDTAGSERYRSITAAYYRRANGLFLMFDITNRSSFDNLNMYME